MKKFFERFKSALMVSYSLEEKLFWALILFSEVIILFTAIDTFLTGMGTVSGILVMACLVVPAIFGVAAAVTRNYTVLYFVYCLVLNCLLLPVSFFFNGGIHSGMPLYCFAALLLCAFSSNARFRLISFGVSVATNLSILGIDILHPGLSVALSATTFERDIFISFTLCSFGLFLAVAIMIEQYNVHRRRDLNDGLVNSIGSIIGYRSNETGDHNRNMKKIMSILLNAANEVIDEADFSREEINVISSASVLHDIGKVAISDAILNKPGRLTDEEYEEMKKHPIIGSQMIESMKTLQNSEYYKYCYDICRHHHEKYDGTGYPDGLKGEEISLVAQLASLADVFEALASKRSYKEACRPDLIYETIVAKNNGHWSERIMKCFLEAWPELLDFIDDMQ